MSRVRNNQGFTLLEIIIAIAVTSLVSVAVASIFIAYQKHESKIRNKEDTLNEINNIHTLFSADPKSFLSRIEAIYGDAYNPNTHRIYFDLNFVPSALGDYYFELQIESEHMAFDVVSYTLHIDTEGPYVPLISVRRRVHKVESDTP